METLCIYLCVHGCVGACVRFERGEMCSIERRRESDGANACTDNNNDLIRSPLVGLGGVGLGPLSCVHVSAEVEKLGGEDSKEQLLRQGLERE